MDDLSDFFDFSKPFNRVNIQSGYLNGNVASSSNNENKIVKREHIGTNYAKFFADAENLQTLTRTENDYGAGCSTASCMDIDDFDNNEGDVKIKSFMHTYEKYNITPNLETDLPINDSRMKILSTIRQNRCIVLEGDTGCGKTTQVPQFILEDAIEREEYCNIICTQPRRIAAISIANRVCTEKKCEIGSIVGYQVGLHANSSEDTCLLYCTTGILLQKLIKTKNMSNYTHIILDEVHERDKDMDFLLIIVRRLLATNSPKTKIVLMSATINTTEFSDYFKVLRDGVLASAPILKVDTRRLYSVKEFYLDDLSTVKPNIEMNYDEPGIPSEMYNVALKLILVCERLDMNDDEVDDLNSKPSILIFLPGINEIEQMEKTMDSLKNLKGINIKIMPIRLHSFVSSEEQQKVFRRPPSNYRKIILSTNIAESSITVPDVKYVIDFCLTKSIFTDTTTNLTSLQLHWASKSNCKQRAGRAGRIMNGRVYRLVSKQFYNNHMDEYGVPEMIRCPLENIILKAKLLDMGAPHSILALAMSPPNLSDIRNTILILKESGALLKTVNKKYEIYDGDLTFIGRVMATLPIDIHFTRLIIFGYIFSMLEDTIIIAAGLNVKSIFDNPLKEQLSAYYQKVIWSDGSGSDIFAILNAYKVWVNKKEQNAFEDDEREASWAQRHFINSRSMREMNLLVKELKSRLFKIGIKEASGYDRVNWMEHEKSIILKIIIAGAFYPNYFIRSSKDNVERERDAYHTLCGHDPRNTVYFSKFDNKYIGQLYVHSIKKLLEKVTPAKNIDIKFEPGTQKVFAIFKNNFLTDNKSGGKQFTLPGRVQPEVYKALKLKKIRSNTSIYVMHQTNAITFAEQNGIGEMRDGKWFPFIKNIKHPELVVIPSIFQKEVKGKITHVEHCGKFWFQPSSEMDRIRDITNQINHSNLLKFKNESEISKGMLVAALFHDKYQRAKILNLEEKSGRLVLFQIIFIDYGNLEIIEFSKLRLLSVKNLQDIPPRVFECCLAGIQPSSINCPNGRWPNEAMQLMQDCVDDQIMKKSFIELEIYSVVNGIASVIIKFNEKTINQKLVENGYAQYSEENYTSKIDHDIRIRRQFTSFHEDESAINEEYLRSFENDNEINVEQIPLEKCKIKLDLNGPKSPLEANIYAAIRIGSTKVVQIDRDSVNSILLDSNLQDAHDSLLVATAVTENSGKGVLTARQTNLMPNIYGFAPLMAMIFCPQMEIRRDKHKTKYVSILCGLGCDSNDQSIFEEHDLLLHLDVEITHNDLETINQIRYSMDTILMTDPGVEIPNILPTLRAELTAKIKQLIIKLLEKPRKNVEVYHDVKEHLWNLEDPNDLLESENIYGSDSIFPFHSGLRLYNEENERLCNFRTNCKQLHEFRKANILSNSIVCKLCDQHLENIVQLRIHLISKLHTDREHQISFNINE